MRLILKLFAVPFALAFTLAAAVFSFVLSASERVLGLVSGLGFLGGVFLLFMGQTTNGIALMGVSFLVSPFGLPAFAGWLVKGIGNAGGALRAFIAS